ncbi:MAG: O-antigen ligase family protein [Lachnospiraceae bacterium]|nr:O-antigen ligase family protein [Lachnospiraceae bacterium]
MKKVDKKRVLYAICFACIMLIDWSRGSGKWHYWAALINLTGVIMTVIMMSHFSWKKQPVRKYALWGGIWLLGSLAGYFIWKQNPGAIFFYQYVTAAVAVGCLGIMALRIWLDRKKLAEASIGHPILAGIWIVMSILMVCSRFGEIWQLYYLVTFGLFYLIPFTRQERRRLWDGLSDGCIIGFFIIQIWAYGFRPYDVVRYSGAYANCNMNSLFYLITYVMILYRLHSISWQQRSGEGTKGKALFLKRCFFVVLAAGLLDFIFFTMTRTALLLAAAITVVYGVIEYFVLERLQVKRMLLATVTLGVCTILIFPCVYLTIRYLPTILHHPVWWEGEYSEEKVHSFDPYNSDKYVSLEEVFEAALGRLYTSKKETVPPMETEPLAPIGNTEDSAIEEVKVSDDKVTIAEEAIAVSSALIENVDQLEFDDVTAPAVALMTKEEKQLLTGDAAQSSMRIRLEIYKRYLNHLNLTGHTLTEGYFPITEDYHAWHAQNVFIQILFYYGVPAGVCFIVLMAALGIGAVKRIWQKRDREDILVLFAWLLFVGYGMLESVWYLGQCVLFLMYITPKILIDARRDDKQTKQ